MNASLNPIDEKLSEQLCAYMDGELPADEARFLERRLANEPVLRAKWERMQLASACLKGHPFQPMARQLPLRIAEALAVPVANPRKPWRLWATAASIAVLALVFAPHFLNTGSNGQGSAVATPVVVSKGPVESAPSPATADFVAIASVPAAVASMVRPQLVNSARPNPALASGGTDAAQTVASASNSPADFPLVQTGVSKSWPRAELPGAANDPSIEAYLVRHNQMLANDGLGGFVPYVDVVTNDPTPATDSGDNSQ
jgi:anti-sigma factor RsiW